MKLTVLGNWSPYPVPGESCSGYLLEVDDKKILLECGNGVVSRLHNYSFTWELDLAIVTHLHPDHSGDLPLLRSAVNVGMLYNYCHAKLPVYITEKPAERFEHMRSFADGLDFRYIDDLEGSGLIRKTKLHDIDISFMPVEHSIPAFAVSIEKDGKKLVYTSDTEYMTALEDFAHKANLLLCEATVMEKNKTYAEGRHLTTKQAGELAKRAEVKQLVATHFFPEYDSAAIREEIKEGLDSNTFKMAAKDEGYEI